jgi:hypothetical protein
MNKHDSLKENTTGFRNNNLYLQTSITHHTMQTNLLTIDQLILKYPFVSVELKWSKEDISALFDGHLLIGQFITDEISNEKILKIEENSFLELIEFRKNVSK